jgi:alkylresorcinol/alkylpyrone synthase/polyketide synthase Type III
MFPRILSIGTANPKQRYSQEEIYQVAAQHFELYRNPRIQEMFMNSDIEFRHLYLDKETFLPFETADELHSRFERGATEIGIQAIQRCFSHGGLRADEVDFVVAVSCTGYLCPGLSSIFIKQLGMRNDVQRADLLGMGCAGAMPGLQRAHDFVKAYPDRKALVVAVEICSACYYVDDSLETVVGNAICSDGAAAVVVGFDDRLSGPSIQNFQTHLEPSFIKTVGFEFREGRLRIVLSKDIRDEAGALAGILINKLLAANKLSRGDIRHWILHSGGRKVIDGVQREVGLSDEQVRHSKCVLKNFGNMSSPTVLFVLDETIRSGQPRSGDLGLMLAMGPGLAIEGALVRW